MIVAKAREGSNQGGGAYAGWSVVVPNCLTVIVAFIGVIVAVYFSAQRADEATLVRERALFTQALSGHTRRALRELESVASSDDAYQNVAVKFDSHWVSERLAGRLMVSALGHRLVVVVDGADEIVPPTYGMLTAAGTKRLQATVAAVLDDLRGRRPEPSGAIPIVSAADNAQGGVAVLQDFLGDLAAVSAVELKPGASAVAPAAPGPVVVSIKLFDPKTLGAQLGFQNLRFLKDEQFADGDYVYAVKDSADHVLARFAWTPVRPGAAITRSVAPFVAIAFGGFCLLAAFVLRSMRRSAAAIAAGEQQLRHLAMHDPLSGLPNRVYFGDHLEAAIRDVAGGAQCAAVFYLDLDHFKDVNDTLGHPVGDELIRAVTLRLSNAVRSNELVARLGGDEFAVLATALTETASLQGMADRLINTLCAPYAINGQTIVIGASIGISIIDGRVQGAADVMRHADLALYRAKNEGRNRACIYDGAMDDNLAGRKLLEADLREAIERGDLRVAYQPVVNNAGDKMLGVEALCRWTHPERGEIPPVEFIPIAENSGLIVALGEYVLRKACTDGNAWPGLTVAVNVSPLQFRRSDFVEVVERILLETGLDPKRLELEVTESTLIGNVDSAELAMFRLKALGARLALDDFGTGYSSLLYLRRFPFDKLKIDRNFVRSIEKAADAAAIVHAVISLGRGLGMTVTAEGVETAEQHLFLRAAGVHSMQGYRFGKPCPAAEIAERLAAPGKFVVKDDPDLALAG